MTSEYSHEWGKEEQYDHEYTQLFTCNAMPAKETRCEISVKKVMLSVPFTMTLRHNIIPNCERESMGLWDGLTSYHLEMTVTEK